MEVVRFSSVTFLLAPPLPPLPPPPVQLTAPIGDDGQLMSSASFPWPVLWLSTSAVQFVLRLRRSLFHSFFCIPLFRSSDFSVPISFLFSFLQTFPFLFCSSFLLFRLFRSYSFLFSARQTFPLVFRSSFPFFFPLVTFWTVGFSEAWVIVCTSRIPPRQLETGSSETWRLGSSEIMIC